jgi:Bacterial transcriptional activator domain/AAA ATPase domain
MLALYRSGRQADALRAFQRALILLTEELGSEPGAELRDLEVAILEQWPGLDRLIVRLARKQPRRQAVQCQIRPRGALVGRADESASIEALLAAGGGGLLLFVGQAGIGKTRLFEEAQELVGEGIVISGRGFEAERGRPYGAPDPRHRAPLR